MLVKCLKADFYKYKRNPVLTAHIVIPVLTALVFMAYFHYSNWSAGEKLSAFYEVLGICFPVLIGIFAASTIEQEQNAGHFQNLLMGQSKIAALFSKTLTLQILGLGALMIASILWILGGQGLWNTGSKIPSLVEICMVVALIIWLAGIPMYLWSEMLALTFGKGAAIGFGIFAGLVNALYLTGIGDLTWKFVPFSWTSRYVDSYLAQTFAGSVDSATGRIDQIAILIFVLVTVGSVAFYTHFSATYEGSRVTD